MTKISNRCVKWSYKVAETSNRGAKGSYKMAEMSSRTTNGGYETAEIGSKTAIRCHTVEKRSIGTDYTPLYDRSVPTDYSFRPAPTFSCSAY